MNATEIIALIALILLILQTATRIPGALADLLRACLPVVDAVRDLTAAAKRPTEFPAKADNSRSRARRASAPTSGCGHERTPNPQVGGRGLGDNGISVGRADVERNDAQ
ncbi:hypothetical protein [Nocardia salmonicida]|uniref:hypothetical protein n=1 Tax=Nocardia salmonicida TaxID=53431 RepID=UPI003719D6F4